MEVSNDFFHSLRGPRFSPQHPSGSSRASVAPEAIERLYCHLLASVGTAYIYGSPMNIQADTVGLCEHCTYIVHIKSKCKCKQNNHTRKIRISINKSLKNKITKGTKKVPDVDLWHQPKWEDEQTSLCKPPFGLYWGINDTARVVWFHKTSMGDIRIIKKKEKGKMNVVLDESIAVFIPATRRHHSALPVFREHQASVWSQCS